MVIVNLTDTGGDYQLWNAVIHTESCTSAAVLIVYGVTISQKFRGNNTGVGGAYAVVSAESDQYFFS